MSPNQFAGLSNGEVTEIEVSSLPLTRQGEPRFKRSIGEPAESENVTGVENLPEFGVSSRKIKLNVMGNRNSIETGNESVQLSPDIIRSEQSSD
jgi:hypothetical protein